MQKLVTVSILVAGIIFLVSSGAQASTAHSHHYEKAVSPFEKSEDQKVAQCELNYHHNGHLCPHKLSASQKEAGLQIGIDCGGTPAGTTPLGPASTEGPPATTSLFGAYLASGHPLQGIPPSAHAFCLPNPFDHPPKAL
jgi:hypothetical protein